jgi:hypothetical protein
LSEGVQRTEYLGEMSRRTTQHTARTGRVLPASFGLWDGDAWSVVKGSRTELTSISVRSASQMLEYMTMPR